MIRFGGNAKKANVTVPAAVEPGSRSSSSESSDGAAPALGEAVSLLTPHERAARQVEKFTSSMTDGDENRGSKLNKCNFL